MLRSFKFKVLIRILVHRNFILSIYLFQKLNLLEYGRVVGNYKPPEMLFEYREESNIAFIFENLTQKRAAAGRRGGGCFALLEGGYNHTILGFNVIALIEGLSP